MGATDESALARASRAIAAGDLVVYPTETVYGLGADALDPAAVECVFEAKGRDREQPISVAVADIDAARDLVHTSEREAAFMERFLPGPVTVLLEGRSGVPDVLSAGQPRLGVRIPDDPSALALAERAGPLTATSANVSGGPNARTVEDLDEAIVAAAAVVLDGGKTPGGESTVVDVAGGTIYRHGALVEEIREWLATH